METRSKKKILFLITKSNWGGAQRYVYDLATNLSPDRFEVAVALGGNGQLVQKLQTAGITVIPIPNLTRDISLKKELLSTRSIATIIHTYKPDVLHVNSSKAGLFGSLLGRLYRVPTVIFTAHGWAFNEDRGKLSRILFAFLHWLTILFAHRTIAVSDAVRTQMQWPFVQTKMTTIHLGRSLPSFLSPDDARTHLATVEPRLKPYREDIWTMTIGELHPVKQHDTAIDAIAQVVKTYPTLRHLIIGGGEEYARLQQRITDLNLGENIFFLGHLHEAAWYLKAADVFIFPSRSEALGYVAIEAAQAQVPIIASNVGGIPEIITHNESGYLVPSGDSQALTVALELFCEHPERFADFKDTASHGVQHFSMENMVTATEALYLA